MRITGYDLPMELRRPLGLLFAFGSLGWPVGYFAFGGFDNDTGSTIIGIGCMVMLVSMASEAALQYRDKRGELP